MASLGQELKRERELRGVSLQEIAESTRINLRLLQALEEDKLDAIPGRFFVRAILRSYAKTIGIDEHQVLNKYQEVYTFEEQLQYRESPERPKTRPRPLSRFFGRKTIRLAALAAVLIGLGLVLIYILVLAPGKKPSIPAKSAPRAAQVEVPEPTRLPEPRTVVEETKGLRLEMMFVEETWIHIYADGQSIWDGTKNKGESLKVRADREVRLNIGNAGGPDLTINGQKAKPLGPRGAVRMDVLITPENYFDFLVVRQEKAG